MEFDFFGCRKIISEKQSKTFANYFQNKLAYS